MTELCKSNDKVQNHLYNSLLKIMFPDARIDFSTTDLTTINTFFSENIVSRVIEIDKHFKEHPELSADQCVDYSNNLFISLVKLFLNVVKSCIGSVAFCVFENGQSYEACDTHYISDIYRELLQCIDEISHTDIGKRVF